MSPFGISTVAERGTLGELQQREEMKFSQGYAVNLKKEEPYKTYLSPWGNSPEGDYGTLANSFFPFASWCPDEHLFQQTLPAGVISMLIKPQGNKAT